MDSIRFGRTFHVNTLPLKDGQLDLLNDVTSKGGRFFDARVTPQRSGIDIYDIPAAKSDGFQSLLREEGIGTAPSA